MKALWILIISILFLNFSCSEEDGSNISNGKILYYVAYENFAWGHQFNGWFMDNQGNVWRLKSHVKWWDKEMNITGRQDPYWIGKDSLFSEYSSKADGIIYQVSQEDLQESLVLKNDITNIDYSSPETVMYDAGGTIYGYLLYDSSRRAFREIPIAQEGDWEYHMKDENAMALKGWLEQVAIDIREKQE